MTPAGLVAELQARGVTLRPDGETLRVRPVSKVTPEELEILKRHKGEVLALLMGPPTEAVLGAGSQRFAPPYPFLNMSLAEFHARGPLLEISVPWLSVTLWMVPTEMDINTLMAEGVSRGRIWTATELMQLMSITDRTPTVVKTIAEAKLDMNGEVTEVRDR